MSKYIYDSRLKGKHSCFNNKLYEKYDLPAREKIKQVFGDFVKDNPDPYKQDLIITDEKFKYRYIELQVCTAWINDKFPYDHLYIYERKNIYGKDTLFITLDKYLTRGYIFDGESYDYDKPQRIKKYSREFIYKIPWHRAMEFVVDKITPEDLELY
jgi:hypothetical protein